ncbi:MAG: hypothetical protein JWM71_158 [Solirubrobacteraceae bacterium]|nr:hypothetical protein [Solirubrobacteraceae bacterium]
MTRLRDIRRNEDGVAMIVAIGVLATMLVLTATVLSSASLLGSSTRNDDLHKRAFEAAEAGLQATLYRLNMLSPATAMCIGGTLETVQAPTGAACAPYTQSLGNGATFTSWTTAPLSLGGSCAGLQVGSSSAIVERCITSTGTVGGVSRRVQTRIASYAGAPLFPLAGVVGLSSVTMSGASSIVGGEGSNGQITLSGAVNATSTTLGPSAPAVSKSGVSDPGPITRRTSAQGPFSFTPVDPGSSATTSDDIRLTNAFATPRGTPADSASGNVTWDAATRSLSMSGTSSVQLGGGIYNFCSLTMSGTSSVTLAPGARTAIYIDSPERSGSGCPASSGSLTMSGTSSFINTSPPAAGSGFAHDPTALQLYIVGKTGSGITLSGTASFYGTIYAPTSAVTLSGTGATFGAVAANTVTISGSGGITGDPNATNITTNAAGLYFRTAWRECLATATTSDPSSGC